MSLAVESIETNTVKLDSLEIRGFRAFEHLRIEKLGRVNLITGKNNVGKTSLLEALQLYAYQGSPEIIWQILDARDEARLSSVNYTRTAKEQFFALKYLFHGRPDIRENIEPIQIGYVDSLQGSLFIRIEFGSIEETANGTRKEWRPRQLESNSIVENVFPALMTRIEGQKEKIHRPDREHSNLSLVQNLLFKCLFVFADGWNDEDIGGLWDVIALTELEEDVSSALRIMVPEIERINIVGNQQSGEDWERIPIVKLTGLNEPIALRSLGEGMNRLFGIALALVNAKDGILLIDEVESGLHYAVQPDVWRLIFETARRLNVQVFATTHSWDCIEAFQSAVQDSDEEDGFLIRLENKNDQIISTLFDKRRLGIATRENIEVR